MSRYLPYGGFKGSKNVNNLDENSVREKSSAGYISKLILNILMNYMSCIMLIH